MVTKIITELTKENLQLVAHALRSGEVVAIPTETVYGLGANGLDVEAMDKIYAAKGRPSDNPLILHVSNAESIKPLVKEISETANKLIHAFWPGPLTITLPKSDLVPNRATGGLNRVALRCPDHAICREILALAGVPIAAPSANISGHPSPTTAQAVYDDMNGRIPYIVDAGICTIGVESTVVEVRDDGITILRPGGITKEMLERVVEAVSYDPFLSSQNEAPKAPGMKYKHYAPDAPMRAFIGSPKAVAQAFTDVIDKQTTKRGAFLVSQETYDLLKNNVRGEFHVYGHCGDAVTLAHDFYKTLHYFNECGVDYILAEGVENSGLGVAIMNRMEKACGGNIIHL